MIGGSPRARGADVGGNGGMLFVLIGNIEDIGKGWRTAAARTACAPRLRFPGDDGAVFLRADLHTRIARGTCPGDHQLGGALQEKLYRLAARLLRNPGALDTP